MLGSIRKFSKTFMAKIFIAIIALPFILWGMGDIFSSGKQNIIAEINLRDMNIMGNIGSRKSFNYRGESLTLQEARFIKNDWSTWKIMLGLNGYYSEVKISTPKKSTSFANPSIIEIENNKYAISLFVPSEGNHYRENNGSVIFLKNK